MSDCQTGENKGFWLGFFLGGILGAVVIFLLGTKEGKKIVGELGEKSKRLISKLEKEAIKKKEEAEGLKENINNKPIKSLDNTTESLKEPQFRTNDLIETTHHRFFKRAGKRLS